jgi:hypothetical protein
MNIFLNVYPDGIAVMVSDPVERLGHSSAASLIHT